MTLKALSFMTISFQKIIAKARTIELHRTRPFLSTFLRDSIHCKVRYYTMEATDSNKEDHLTRTSSNTRDAGVHSMTVKAVSKLSPTIKEVVLEMERSSSFTFKAGQWVDVFVPGVDTVGGFSMCSSPQELTSQDRLRLAIKYSSHPPALWMHEKCSVGDKVNVRVGGDFFMTSEHPAAANKYALLVAGGVGINPLTSMVHYAMESDAGLRICLLYSAKSPEELIFKESFDNYSKSKRNFTVKYFVTGDDMASNEANMTYQRRRICASDLKEAKDWLVDSSETSVNERVDAFICGPPPMIQEVSEILSTLNITQIHFEKWW